ncbi:DUF1684 domain-containing protein [Halospeciosus flavus]|uniref:DUF1684 domain-containing protein n=1 Tax=Halospeciosus flavus TaxID=3032283 RepID=A0ABD5Z4W0_9EURY|nr:DUF1684 domain-containing protein [Halospeciosus flavus]
MSESDFDEEAWRERVTEFRREKDEFFTDHPQSPIPPEKRDAFEGLNYYDLDPDYRVTARLQWVQHSKTVSLEMTKGNAAEYERVATLGFGLDGEHHVFDAFRAEGMESLFVPFADATNGDTTYDIGRYLELDVTEEEADTGDEVVLDFNVAYAPFCAYSETYACPLPPEQNHLDVRVEAGEKRLEL